MPTHLSILFFTTDISLVNSFMAQVPIDKAAMKAHDKEWLVVRETKHFIACSFIFPAQY